MRKPRQCFRALQVLALVAVGVASAVVPASAADFADQKYPDVVAAKVRPNGSDRFDFDPTISSPYDTPQRYADTFRVIDKTGAVYGERRLWHDHGGEQAFTRVVTSTA